MTELFAMTCDACGEPLLLKVSTLWMPASSVSAGWASQGDGYHALLAHRDGHAGPWLCSRALLSLHLIDGVAWISP